MSTAVNIALTRPGGNPWGAHRVVSPQGVLPQTAEVLDVSLPIFSNELLLAVECLLLDSASMRQLNMATQGDARQVGKKIQKIVDERGKMQNPVTGSGGMLLGRVLAIGKDSPHRLQIGDRVATLVSLTLTPLALQQVKKVDLHSGQVWVEGHAIIFASGLLAPMPSDIADDVALAAFDVCGAPAWVKRLVTSQDRVLILGRGRAGLLAMAAALDVIAPNQLRTLDNHPLKTRDWPQAWRPMGHFTADATQPLPAWRQITDAGEEPFDLVVNTCNSPETEALALLSVKPGGKVLFFNMATSFSRAVLTAEGLGKDAQLIMGNGFARGHAEYALNLLKRNPSLCRMIFPKDPSKPRRS